MSPQSKFWGDVSPLSHMDRRPWKNAQGDKIDRAEKCTNLNQESLLLVQPLELLTCVLMTVHNSGTECNTELTMSNHHHHRLLHKKQHIEIHTHKKLTLKTYYNKYGKIKLDYKKSQTSTIDGIPNIVVPNALLNRITGDIQ